MTEVREKIIDMLNALHAHDAKALCTILAARTPFDFSTNPEDERIPVVTGRIDGVTSLGPLGIINGILFLFEPQAKAIGATYSDDESEIIGFS